jgi:hypothetical protein
MSWRITNSLKSKTIQGKDNMNTRMYKLEHIIRIFTPDFVEKNLNECIQLSNLLQKNLSFIHNQDVGNSKNILKRAKNKREWNVIHDYIINCPCTDCVYNDMNIIERTKISMYKLRDTDIFLCYFCLSNFDDIVQKELYSEIQRKYIRI